jgi:chromosomal replication initiation ATPase DnaA
MPRRRAAAQRACDEVIALVARQRNVPIRLLIHKSRSRRPAARARQLAMYLAHVVLGRSLTEIGTAFGRDRTTVSYACALIEDLRDDPRFDAEVEGFEQQLMAGLAPEAGEVRHAA